MASRSKRKTDPDAAVSERKRRSGASFPRISGAPVNDSVGTLDILYDDLDAIFHPTYDPCPLNGATTPGVPNGLSNPWGFTTFVNPPYSEIAPWLALAVNNLAIYGTRSIFLIPAHVETVYWQNFVIEWASEVWYCVTGLRFNGYKEKFSMPMCLVLFGQFDDELPLDRTPYQLVFLGENNWRTELLPRGARNARLRRADRRRLEDQARMIER